MLVKHNYYLFILLLSSLVSTGSYAENITANLELLTRDYLQCRAIQGDVDKKLKCFVEVFKQSNFSCEKLIIKDNLKEEQVIDCLNAYGQWQLINPESAAAKKYAEEIEQIRPKNNGEYGRVMDFFNALEGQSKGERSINENPNAVDAYLNYREYSLSLSEAFHFMTTPLVTTDLSSELMEKSKKHLGVDDGNLHCLPMVYEGFVRNSGKVVYDKKNVVNRLKILIDSVTEFLAVYHAHSYGRVSPFKNQINKVSICLPTREGDEIKAPSELRLVSWLISRASSKFRNNFDRRLLFRDYTLYVAPTLRSHVKLEELLSAWNSPELVRCEAVEEKIAGKIRAKIKYALGGEKGCLIREGLAQYWEIFNPLSRSWKEVKMAILKIKREIYEQSQESADPGLHRNRLREIISSMAGKQSYFTVEDMNYVKSIRNDVQAISNIYLDWKQGLRNKDLLLQAFVESFSERDKGSDRPTLFLDGRDITGDFFAFSNSKRIEVSTVLKYISPTVSGEYAEDFAKLGKSEPSALIHPCMKQENAVKINFYRGEKISGETSNKEFEGGDSNDKSKELSLENGTSFSVEGPGYCLPNMSVNVHSINGEITVSPLDDVKVEVNFPQLDLITKVPLKKSIDFNRIWNETPVSSDNNVAPSQGEDFQFEVDGLE